MAHLAREEGRKLAAEAQVKIKMEVFIQFLLQIRFNDLTAKIIQVKNGFQTINLILEVGMEELFDLINNICNWIFQELERSHVHQLLTFSVRPKFHCHEKVVLYSATKGIQRLVCRRLHQTWNKEGTDLRRFWSDGSIIIQSKEAYTSIQAKGLN